MKLNSVGNTAALNAMKTINTLILLGVVAIVASCDSPQSMASVTQESSDLPKNTVPVTYEWIRDLITVTQKTMLDARKQPGKNYFIGWKNDDDVVTEIILFRDHPQPEPEVIVQDYAVLKKAIRQLPSGSFVSYTFSDFRKDLLNYQQIKELHDLCAKNGMHFLLHMGG